jgi:D-alanyl-D-alanine dipeptidase
MSEALKERYATTPIPALRAPQNWRAVPIRDNRESLEPLGLDSGRRVVAAYSYRTAGFAAALAECVARAGVVRRLAQAAASLPPGWQIVVFDAWRPIPLQREIYEHFAASLRRQWPASSEAEVQTRVERYIARPSLDPRAPSPHATGGAVDVGLRDATGQDVDMGTEFDAFRPEAGTRYFETLVEGGAVLDGKQRAGLEHRRLLFHAMVAQGFTNYPEEWWHFDFGNQWWADIRGEEGIYSLAAPPEP